MCKVEVTIIVDADLLARERAANSDIPLVMERALRAELKRIEAHRPPNLSTTGHCPKCSPISGAPRQSGRVARTPSEICSGSES